MFECRRDSRIKIILNEKIKMKYFEIGKYFILSLRRFQNNKNVFRT